jgi:polar amino acid transport system permease protein
VNYLFDWSVIARNWQRFAAGLGLSLGMAAAALILGSILGLAVAYARLARSPAIRLPAAAYVEFMRNTPLLLLVVFVYFGLPELGIYVLEKIESFILTLTLYAAAYMSEVFRAGLASMPRQYAEAAKAIGMRPWQRQRHVVLPVMLRTVLPAAANNLISLFKDTSLATAIAVPELTFVARQINANTFRVMEAWLTASALYLATCLLISAGLRLLERRFAMVR